MKETYRAEPPLAPERVPLPVKTSPAGNGLRIRRVQFGTFELDLETGELRNHGLKVKLQGKPFQILNALLERPGEVVTRDQLRSRLWPADTFVDFESGLNTAANRLRLTLGDSADHPRYVETLARTGYRFIAPVTIIAPIAAPPLTAVHAAPTIVTAVDTAEIAPPQQRDVAHDVPQDVPATPSRAWRRWAAAALFATVAISVAWQWLRPAPQLPAFSQITFRRGIIGNARFTLDGQTVVYSGRVGDDAKRLYVANLNSPESRQLDISDAALAAVSRSGELAILQYAGVPTYGARLARVPLNGGAPMPVADHVALADWLPDASSLVIARNQPRGASIEFPVGKEIYRTTAWVDALRVSPSGDAVAFLEHPVAGDDAGQVKILDAKGQLIAQSSAWGTAAGLAWAANGREVLFTAASQGALRQPFAISREGKIRQVASAPASVRILDVAPDGRMLVARDLQRLSMLRAGNSADNENDLSWFDWSRPQDLSADGNLVLFDETGQAGGANYMVYLHDIAKGSTTRVGEGRAQALSPDQKFALTLGAKDRTYLSMVPLASPGQPRRISGAGIEYQWARFFPGRQNPLGRCGDGSTSALICSVDRRRCTRSHPARCVSGIAGNFT